MTKVEESTSEGLSRRSVSVRPISSSAETLTFGELEAKLATLFPFEGGESWDISGLTVGNRDEVITGVAVALDPTPSAIALADARGANLLVTHHPPYLSAPRRFCSDIREAEVGGASVWEAARRGVGLMNFHTCLDVTARAAALLPSLLSLHFTERFVHPLKERSAEGYGALCTIEPDDPLTSLGQLAARCTSIFGRPPRVWGQARKGIGVICCLGGSAGSFLNECLEANVDTLVCGEVHYHDALAASAAGLGIIELGHDISEFPLAVMLIDEMIEAGLTRDTIMAIDQSSHWAYPDAVRL